MTILELLRSKEERNKNQQEFYEKIKIKVEPIKAVENNMVVPYGEDMKTQGQVIGNAYKIALILYIASKNSNLNVRMALNTDPFLTEETVMTTNVYFENNPTDYIEANHYHRLYQKITTPETDLSLDTIAESALYLAWHKLFLKTGYWPKDLAVLSKTSETYIKLKNELLKLLLTSKELIVEICLATDVVINPKYTYRDLDVQDELDLYANNILYSFTTSESLQSTTTNIQRMRGLIEINSLLEKYPINKAVTYYVRYNDTLEVI